MLIHPLEVFVIDTLGQPVLDAVVTAVPEREAEERWADAGPPKALFDKVRQIYFFPDLYPGFYTLSVKHPDYQHQERRVQVHPKPTREVFILYQGETAYVYRGNTRVPYVPQPDLIGIIFSRKDDAEKVTAEKLNSLFDRLGLEPLKVTPTFKPGLADNDQLRLRAIVVRQRHDSPFYKKALAILRAIPYIEEAGPVFRYHENMLTIFTNRIMVQFYPEVSRDEREKILKRHDLRLIEQMSFAPNLFLTAADPSIDEEINNKVEQLVQTGRVIYAEPSLAELPELDAVVPNDFLWPGCWDRRVVEADGAWELLGAEFTKELQFGRPDVIVAVVDNGVKSCCGVPVNADFQGTVSDGSNKTYKLFDFIRMDSDNDVPLPDPVSGTESSHGMACAGVALSLADNGIGITGVAPNTRLIGLIYPIREEEIYNMFLWAAGLQVQSPNPQFPPQITPGADIFTCSIGFGEGLLTSGTVKNMLQHLTNRGRNGKGCLAIFSAGNGDQNIVLHRPYGDNERSFSCAASTLKGVSKEIRAPYSNFGEVAWCVPSSSDRSGVHNPPNSYGIWTTSFPGQGNLPASPGFTTALDLDAPASARVVTVQDVTGLRQDDHILINEPSKKNCESAFITFPPDPVTKRVRVQSLFKKHKQGEPVFKGPEDYSNNFGGTSAAAPSSAGICGLVLSANPGLTWIEVREILRTTAVKIDDQNSDPIGQWLDNLGNPSIGSGSEPFFSQWYGYGRLNAKEAVRVAIEEIGMNKRDLMIRKTQDDTGIDLNLAFGESPDIWVRNTDPASDPDALAVAFDEPGPHQTPSRGMDQWVYARVKNIGTEASLDAWVRFHVALTDGTPLRYSEDWEPKNGSQTSSAWDPGVYYIGEVSITDVPAGTDITVNISWPKGLIPPASAAEAGLISSLLVEVLPLDGPISGENNNLAQRRIDIND